MSKIYYKETDNGTMYFYDGEWLTGDELEQINKKHDKFLTYYGIIISLIIFCLIIYSILK